jgi:hypothetical protein
MSFEEGKLYLSIGENTRRSLKISERKVDPIKIFNKFETSLPFDSKATKVIIQLIIEENTKNDTFITSAW